MKRRTVILGGMGALAGAAASLYSILPDWARMLLGNYGILPSRIPVLIERDFGWKGSDFLAGGTKSLAAASLPPPAFREKPNCVATLANIVGPCDADAVPVRVDISEGRTGLPLRLSLRLVDVATCRPHGGAEVQIWHTNPKGIYSGRDASAECTFNDAEATSGLAFRGRQMTDDKGVASFFTVYPGWYAGRSVHVHVRAVVGGREVLVSQIFFDDLLSDAIFADHPDYSGRAARDTRNDKDLFMPRKHLNAHIFDFDKLAGGIMQASFTIGIAA